MPSDGRRGRFKTTWNKDGSSRRAYQTKMQILEEEALERDFIVRTQDTGEGYTKYRFFSLDSLAMYARSDGLIAKRIGRSQRELVLEWADGQNGQGYYGPYSGSCTAIGIQSAYRFLYTGFCAPDRSRSGRW